MTRSERVIREYFGRFAGILDKSQIVIDRTELRSRPNSRSISAGTFTRTWDEPSGIRFVDGSYLSFREEVDVIDGKLVVTGYTYRFVSNNQSFTFRYDKDTRQGETNVWKQPDGNMMWHPTSHLHFQDIEEIRYKTHETTLEEILNFVRMCFVSQ